MNDNVTKSSFQGPLAPKVGFGSPQNPTQLTPPEPPKKNGGQNRILKIGVVLGIALILPLTIWLVSQQQDVRQRASERPADAVLKVGNEYITGVDVDLRLKNLLGSEYEENKYDPQLWQEALDSIQEEKIIEFESKKLGISVSQDEIVENGRSSFELQQAQNTLLKSRLSSEVVSWRLVNLVSMNVATDSSQTNYNQVYSRATDVLESIIEGATNGESLLVAATNYSDADTEINVRIFMDGTWPKKVEEAIFNLVTAEMSEIIESDEKLTIFEIIDVNDTEYESFEQWYRIIKPAVSGL